MRLAAEKYSVKTGTFSMFYSANEYYSFGMLMPERSFSSPAYRFGFNGKEMDDEVKGEGNNLVFEARIFDTRLGRWLSRDPRESEYPWQSTNAYFGNSPIVQIDYLGMGDFYDKGGKHLGSDGKTIANDKGKQIPDNLVHVTTQEAFDCNTKEGKTDWDNLLADGSTKKLNIGHDKFQEMAATVYGESSKGYGIESKEELFAIASTHTRNSIAYGAKSLLAKKFNKTNIDARNGTFMQVANAAMINTLTGGTDFSNGATMWDGAEQANLSGQECSENGFESHSAVMGWSISPQLYSKWKTNVENKFGKKFFIAPEYNRAWNYGNYKNSGLMRLQATAVHGLTIFWQQRSPKNSANE